MRDPKLPWPPISTEAAKTKIKSSFEQFFLDSDYRTAALFMSYLGKDGHLHIAHGSALQCLEDESPADLRLLAKSLRVVADGLEELCEGRGLQAGFNIGGIRRGAST